jgi:hypothetical protein
VSDFVQAVRPIVGSWNLDHTFEFSVDLATGGGTSRVLAAEANTLRSDVTMFSSTGTTCNEDGSVTSDSRFGFVAAGPLLAAIHESAAVVDFVRNTTGISDLTPWRAGYNYYRAGDHLGVHRDARRAAVTLLAALTDDLPDLRWAPELIDADVEVIERISSPEPSETVPGIPLPVPRNHFRAFNGSRVPHWRQPFPHSFGMLATCSYRRG